MFYHRNYFYTFGYAWFFSDHADMAHDLFFVLWWHGLISHTALRPWPKPGFFVPFSTLRELLPARASIGSDGLIISISSRLSMEVLRIGKAIAEIGSGPCSINIYIYIYTYLNSVPLDNFFLEICWHGKIVLHGVGHLKFSSASNPWSCLHLIDFLGVGRVNEGEASPNSSSVRRKEPPVTVPPLAFLPAFM